MTRLGIHSVAHVFGDEPVDNEDVARRYNFDVEFIKNKVGVEKRYQASRQQATSDLAIAATQKALAAANLSPGDIGFLCLVTQTPDYQLPHTAALVQHALGLKDSTPTFDVSLGCSGYVYGLSIALAFMEANRITKGLLVTADTYSKVVDPVDRATAPLFSDAAAATILSDSPAYRAGKGVFGTDGSGAERLIVKEGGSRFPGGNACLFMDGRAIFNFMMTRIPANINECLAQNGVDTKEIDAFVFHQANKFMLDSLAERMKLPGERVVRAHRECGNTVASSIPIALREVLTARPDKILISGFGVGLSWASNILFRQ